MRKIISYIKIYLSELSVPLILANLLFIGFYIYLNYGKGLTASIHHYSSYGRFFSWYLIFFCAFGFGYLAVWLFLKKSFFHTPHFLFLFLLAPALFAWKMIYQVTIFSPASSVEKIYWNHIFYYPVKLVFILACLLLLWKFTSRDKVFYGVSLRQFNPAPYGIMLLIMIPLVSLAATQADFLAMYPKLKSIAFLKGQSNGWYKLLYELSYGTDFFTIELFFRGFLVLGFARWAGKNAILPMALFYCTIHFGKPLGECISSFFGGLLLGIVSYETGSIFGGLIVHLGIAWMMELAGYLGNGHL